MSRARIVLAFVFPWLALGAAALAAPACTQEQPAGDVCEQASHVFEHCGASLPLLESGSCTGLKKAVATCVANHASSCDELGSLSGRIDSCVNDMLDGGDSFLPPDNLPGPATKHDAGKDGSSSGDGAPPPPPPPPPPPTDAGVDAQPADASTAWSGMTVSGTVANAEEQRFQTPALPPGSYTFDMTGTGDVDLYVKVGSSPRTNSYDCRPFAFDSNESCTVTVTTTDIVYVMARGEASSASTFTIKGHL